MIYTELLVPLMMFIGACLLWLRLRQFSALAMAVGFFFVLISTVFSVFGPAPFTVQSGGFVPNEIFSLLIDLVLYGATFGSLLAAIAFLIFAARG